MGLRKPSCGSAECLCQFMWVLWMWGGIIVLVQCSSVAPYPQAECRGRCCVCVPFSEQYWLVPLWLWLLCGLSHVFRGLPAPPNRSQQLSCSTSLFWRDGRCFSKIFWKSHHWNIYSLCQLPTCGCRRVLWEVWHQQNSVAGSEARGSLWLGNRVGNLWRCAGHSGARSGTVSQAVRAELRTYSLDCALVWNWDSSSSCCFEEGNGMKFVL